MTDYASMLKKCLALKMLVLLGILCSGSAWAERVKDLVSIQGVRDNPLLGYGLIVGLSGTGDKFGSAAYTEQSMRTLLAQYGVTVPDSITLQSKNVAAVSVHATLPPFMKPGQTLDITVSSIGDSESLRGGTLLMTPLKGADQQIYAVAQGDVVVGGLGAEGADGSSIAVNVTSVGRIPNGATIERTVRNNFGNAAELMLNLHVPDFTTAQRLQTAINQAFGEFTASARDAVSVRVQVPQNAGGQVAFISILENLEVTPDEYTARIVVNSRTGTIVIGNNVRVLPAAVAHGDVTVTIEENVQVNQPNPLANGETTQTPDSSLALQEEPGALETIKGGVTLREVVDTLNRVGTTTSDIIAILEALKQAGALRGQLTII